MKKSTLFFVFFLAGIFFVPTGFVRAGECYSDPVYERNATGTAVIGARVRSGACMEGTETLATVNAGAKVNIIAATDGWYKVKTESGIEGWMGARLVATQGETENVPKKELVSEAVKEKKEMAKEKTETEKAKLAERLKGRILLDVENHGEAWYVRPEDGSRLYLKDGGSAYELMRELGLGVSNADFERLQTKQANLFERLKGKIILLVQKHGEAYYINPADGSLHYLKDGKEAYRIMRELSLGIRALDLKNVDKKELKDVRKEVELKKREALKAEKEKIKSEKEEKKNEAVEEDTDGVLKLSARAEDGHTSLSWNMENMEAPQGFKVVMSEKEHPTYPGNSAQYVGSGMREYVWKGLKAGTYHFRVCRYTGAGACVNYSNDVSVTLAATEVPSGNISLKAETTDEGKVILAWSLQNMTSEMGFKVVVSENENPVYPGNDYHYLSDADTRSDTWSGLKTGTTYFFRVCEYLGGKCGVYSNNVKVAIPAS